MVIAACDKEFSIAVQGRDCINLEPPLYGCKMVLHIGIGPQDLALRCVHTNHVAARDSHQDFPASAFNEDRRHIAALILETLR